MTETTASISDSEKPVTFGSFLSKNLSSERFNVFTNSKAAPLFSKVSNLKMSKENISQRLQYLNEEIYNLSMLINAKQFEESSFTSSLDIIDDKIKEIEGEIARTDEHNPILNLTGKEFDEIFARYGLKFICVYSATDNARIYFYKPSHMVGELPVGPVVYYLKYISTSTYKMIFSEAIAYPLINIASRDNGYDTYFHPHINSLNGSAYDNATVGSAYYGKVCLGNFGDILNKANVTLAMDSFEEHVALFNSLVQTYNSGSPYRRPDQIIPLYEERGMMHNLTKKVGLPSKEKQKYLPSANINLGIFNTYVASGKIPFNAITNVDDIRSFCKKIVSGTSLYDIIEKRINSVAHNYFYDGCKLYTGDADYVWRKIQMTRSSEVTKAIEQNPEIDIINMIYHIFSKLENLFTSMHNDYLMNGSSAVDMDTHREVLNETYSILSSYDVLQSVKVIKAGSALLNSINSFEEFISGTNASEVNVSEDSPSSDEDTDNPFETEYEVDDSEYTDEYSEEI